LRNRTPNDHIKSKFWRFRKRKPALTLTEKKPKWKCYRQIDAFESTEKDLKVVLIICCLQNEFWSDETMPFSWR
jgi:hypothetical protein